MQYLYLIGYSYTSLETCTTALSDLSFAAGANANAISSYTWQAVYYIDWISFAAGANANAISIYLIGYSYTSLETCTTALSDLSFAAGANANAISSYTW